MFPISESAAQAEWQRTVQVIVPVEDGKTTRALTDSVVAMAEAQDAQIRRSPKSDTTAALETVKASLSNEGLALTSASHVFITYRFTLKNSRLKRNIRDLHFIYRPSAEQGKDVPILYVDLTENQFYKDLLIEQGTPSSVNEAVYHPFKQQIAFHGLLETATVVKVGNEIIRDPEQADAEKEQIMATIRRLTYNR